ncbi:MAG: site-specific integrase [Acidobacteria bacterium]|nr:MAG: site-specific integrase [Acidobacteriota bacterium]
MENSSVNSPVANRRIQLNHNRVNGRPTLRAEAKTASGRRSVELDTGTVSVLREHRRRQIEDRLKAGSVWQDTGLVFCREDGTLIKPEWLTRTFNARAKSAGLPKIRLHDLRHTWATLALGAGVHPKIVSERLGHSTISVTLDLYSHVSPGMDKAVAELVAALFR